MAGNSVFKQTKKDVEIKTSPFNSNQEELKYLLNLPFNDTIVKKTFPFFIVVHILTVPIFPQIKFRTQQKNTLNVTNQQLS